MSAGPSEGFLSSYFRNPFKSKKKGKDINLPMPPGGKRDPRLPKPSTADEIGKGYKVFKSLGRLRKKEEK